MKPLYNEKKKKRLFENCVLLKEQNNDNDVEYFLLDKKSLFPVSNISLVKNKKTNVFTVAGSYSESGYGKLLYLMALMDLTKEGFYMSSSYDGSMRGHTIDIWNDFIFSSTIESNFYPDCDCDIDLLETFYEDEEFFINKYGKEKIEELESIDYGDDIFLFLEKNNMVLNNVYLKCKKNPDEFYSLFYKKSKDFLKDKKFDIELIKDIGADCFSILYDDADYDITENKTFKINNFYNYFDKKRDDIHMNITDNNIEFSILRDQKEVLFYFDISKNKDKIELKQFFSKNEFLELSEELFHFILLDNDIYKFLEIHQSESSDFLLINKKFDNLECEYQIEDFPVVIYTLNRKIKYSEPAALLEFKKDLLNKNKQSQKKKIKI